MDESSEPQLPARQLPTHQLPDYVLKELAEAREILEHRGIADRLTEMLGAPITASIKMLPDSAEKAIYGAVDKSLSLALDFAVNTLGDKDPVAPKPRLFSHKLMAGLSGAAGGAFGGATIAAELPFSTVLILRSVADIARSLGEDLTDMESRLACLEVFALDPGHSPGKSSNVEDDTEIGYLAVRLAMGRQIHEASQHVVKHGLTNKAAPPLVQFISTIGKRFGVVVSEKLAAQAIPVIGAVGGALINTYFIDHYQNLARAHFTIRRLEREHGAALIQAAYRSLPRK
ncbi:EcsC protein family protein [Posidoniimonas polymericola]|uniref:EcsC protein family protein n=1 Tax=Posidoniimonas polymericola TaxID=2528002 RepID=A0A5C5YT08_9BACT|nr:EcsC family protein [Posidoniimonas polymericola]TWT78078.1 EcsC protein family protein [Posidoniimonas polymericola]